MLMHTSLYISFEFASKAAEEEVSPEDVERVSRFLKREKIYSQLQAMATFLIPNEPSIHLILNLDGKSYTDGQKIVVGLPKYMMKRPFEEIFAAICALLGHESQHVNSSNFKAYGDYRVSFEGYFLKKYPHFNVRVMKKFSSVVTKYFGNGVEDGRIERILCAKLEGYLKYIRYFRAMWWKNQPVTGQSELNDFLFAIVTVATMGLLPKSFKKHYEGTEAMNQIEQLRPMILEGIRAISARRCLELCEEMIYHAEPYLIGLLENMTDEEQDHMQSTDTSDEYTTSSEKDFNRDDTETTTHFKKEKKQKDKPEDKEEDKKEESKKKPFKSDKKQGQPEEKHDDSDKASDKEEGAEEEGAEQKEDSADKQSDDPSNEGSSSPNEDEEDEGDPNSDTAKGDGDDADDTEEDEGSPSDDDTDDTEDDNEGSPLDRDGDNKDSDDEDCAGDTSEGDQDGQDDSSMDGDADDEGDENSKDADSSDANAPDQGDDVNDPSSDGDEGAEAEALDESIVDEAFAKIEEELEADGIKEKVAEDEPSLKNPTNPEKNAAASQLTNEERKAIEEKYKDQECNTFEERRGFPMTHVLPGKFKEAGRRFRKDIERILKNKQPITYRGQKRGMLDAGNLWKLGTKETNVFMKRNVPTMSDYVAYLLKDGSGSMSEDQKQFHAGFAVSVAEEGLKGFIPFKIAEFSTNNYSKVIHHVIKDFKENAAANYTYNHSYHRKAKDGNKDGFSIRIATAELLKRPEKDRILIVFSDGLPSDYPTDEVAKNDVKNAVKEARAKGIFVVSVLFGTELFRAYNMESYRYMYGNSVISCDPGDISSKLVTLLKKLIVR